MNVDEMIAMLWHAGQTVGAPLIGNREELEAAVKSDADVEKICQVFEEFGMLFAGSLNTIEKLEDAQDKFHAFELTQALNVSDRA